MWLGSQVPGTTNSPPTQLSGNVPLVTSGSSNPVQFPILFAVPRKAIALQSLSFIQLDFAVSRSDNGPRLYRLVQDLSFFCSHLNLASIVRNIKFILTTIQRMKLHYMQFYRFLWNNTNSCTFCVTCFIACIVGITIKHEVLFTGMLIQLPE